MHPKPQFFLVEKDRSWANWMESSLDKDLDWSALMEIGALYCNGKRMIEPLPLKAGDILRVHPRPRRYSRPVPHFKSQVAGETEDHLILWKPSGIPVHPTLDNRRENLLSWCCEDLGQKLYITHRLDIGTEGLIVLAKNPKAQAHFNQMLMRSKVRKIYRATGASRLQRSIPPRGPWVHWMKDSDRAPKVLTDENPGEGWLLCESRALEIQELSEGSIEVRLQLITGRTHQIRAQMAFWGFPLLGDKLYGGVEHQEPQESWSLACVSLGFPHQGEFKEWTQTSTGQIEFHRRRLEDTQSHSATGD